VARVPLADEIPAGGPRAGGGQVALAYRRREAVLVGRAGVGSVGPDRLGRAGQQSPTPRWDDGQRSVGPATADGPVLRSAGQRSLVAVHLLPIAQLRTA